MFSRFFIDRPIFASVLSIMVTLAGSIAGCALPIAQYPEIAPPTVEVSAVYPGANADVVAKTVAAPIEQQVNGVEGMLYMSSQCTNDGTYTLSVTFEHGVDLNIAQVLVQNRVSLAQPVLPPLVTRRGVSVKKKSSSVLMIVNLFSPDETRDALYLSNYATIQLRDELARLQGVGDITYLGRRDFSMRVWLDPQKMQTRNLTSSDVIRAIEEQNTQVAAGQVGQPPVSRGQVFQFTATTMGRLVDERQFSDIILKADAFDRKVYLRDVATVEMGAQEYNQTCTLDRQPSVALSVYQLPGSNALEVARQVRHKMEELKGRFPRGVDYAIVYDTTPFINESIREVFKTLGDAVVLVAIVVLLFLQNWRSAIIPLIAVPVAIIGTFAVMAAMGFSLNNLTLFGLVLAIGIVVDDAIVVVEAVEHHIERGLSPRDATIKAMQQVSGPVIAVGLVLSAVFIPCAFIAGISGQFYRQFALTIAVSTVLSAFNSLTLSPALTALLLKPRTKGVYEALPKLAFLAIGGLVGYQFLTGPVSHWLDALVPRLPATLAAEINTGKLAVGLCILVGIVFGWMFGDPLNRALGWFFGWFNDMFNRSTGLYARMVGSLLRVSMIVLIVYAGLLYLTYIGFTRMPSGFIPNQDKGYLLVNVQMPDGSSLERTEKVMRQIEKLAKDDPGVEHTVAIAGQSILINANAPNFGAMFVMLKDFDQRDAQELSGPAVAARLQETLQAKIDDAVVAVYGAPPVEGLGTAGGFKVIIEDRGDGNADELQAVADNVVYNGNQKDGLEGLYTSYRSRTPWLSLDVDRFASKGRGVSLTEVFSTLQVYLGSYYVNDFNRFGRTWQVNLQALPSFRSQISDIKAMKMRSERGGMVPLAAFTGVRPIDGPVMISRYNMYPCAIVNGNPAPGVSSGEAIDRMNDVVEPLLTPSMRHEWTELALFQQMTGNTAWIAFVLAVILVFLVLAAQYESWSLPLAVILVVPMCLLCSIVGVAAAQLDINIFTQVGFIVLVGLACKNAILIVEFAKAQREAGVDRHEATLEACRLRLRPIIMTSFAFILGVVPLVISRGAGAEMRRTLGTAVFAGMLGVTMFGIFLTPVFYYVIQWFADRRQKRMAGPSVTVFSGQVSLNGGNGIEHVEMEKKLEISDGHGH
jgi:multidrug efflux pump subunit AcrB